MDETGRMLMRSSLASPFGAKVTLAGVPAALRIRAEAPRAAAMIPPAVAGNLRVFNRISDAVGDTPMVRLEASVAGLPGEVFAKLEFLNPMGSVKDRIARYILEKALAEGRLSEGDVIVESSSGNTAMGLAMMAVLYGLRCKMVVRRQTSQEKLDALRAMGVELVLVDGTLPPEHPDSYNRKAEQVVAETPGAFCPDQHNNRENNEAHYATTGPEIWRQMEGRIDYLVAGLGTGCLFRRK